MKKSMRAQIAGSVSKYEILVARVVSPTRLYVELLTPILAWPKIFVNSYKLNKIK